MALPEPVRTPHAAGPREVLVVEVAGERHGLVAAEIEMVAQAVTITPLRAPHTSIEGLITYRAQHVPVMDFRTRLGLPPKALAHTDHFVILAALGRKLAVRVDRAAALVRVDMRPLGRAVPAEVTGGVAAVAHGAEGPLFVHDLAALLDGQMLPAEAFA